VRSGARLVGAGLLAALAAVPALIYAYAIEISAGLCGDGGQGWARTIAVVVPLIVVGWWGFRHGNWIFLAWPAAVLSAAALASLAAYLDPGAHGHCETMTPNSFNPPFVSRYS
jgi:hypothetical protein